MYLFKKNKWRKNLLENDFHNCLKPNCFSNISALKVPSIASQPSLNTL